MVRLRRGFKWTKRRKISATLITLWGIVFAVSIWIPADSIGEYMATITDGTAYDVHVTHVGENPPLQYNATAIVKANGAFSAFNYDTKLTVRIYNANRSDWAKYYCCVALWYGNSSIDPFLRNTGWNTQAIPLNRASNGTYLAYATIGFKAEGPAYLALLPYSNAPIFFTSTMEKQWEQSRPIVFVGPTSETLQIFYNENTVKLGIILGTFSILFLEPLIIDLVVVPREEEK